MRKNVKAMYFYAYWDENVNAKNLFIETCKAHKMPYEAVDCETEMGVKLSCKYNVKLCPMVLFFKDGKEVGRFIGNHAYEQVQNFVK